MHHQGACSPSATWMMSSSMRRPTGNRPRGTTATATQAMRYTMLQTSWLPLGTKTCPDARVWGGFQRCTIACMNLGSIPNLLTAKWLQLNLLLSITPLLVPLFSCGAAFLLVCFNVISFILIPPFSFLLPFVSYSQPLLSLRTLHTVKNS